MYKGAQEDSILVCYQEKSDSTKTEHLRVKLSLPYKNGIKTEKEESLRIAEYFLEEVYDYLPEQTYPPETSDTGDEYLANARAEKIMEEKANLVGIVNEALEKIEDRELYEKYASKIGEWSGDLALFSLIYGQKNAIKMFVNNLEGVRPNDKETERTKSLLKKLENRLVCSSV